MRTATLKRKSHHIVLCFFALAIRSFSALAQTPGVTFESYTDAKEVLINSYFEVSFTLKSANGTDFSAPNFSDFTVVAGPNSSTSMQIINGQVSREMGYSYTLQPKKEGVFTIGSASIKANGNTILSNPLSVKVLKGNAGTGTGIAEERQAYVVIEPSKDTAYPGEQILLDFKLYTTVSLDGYDITEEPDYKGFYMQEMRRFNSRTQHEVINGKQVTSKVLRRLALFPQQSGALTIPSARVQLAMIEDNNRTGFFFSRNIKPIFVETDPVTIIVKELPSPSPTDFAGAVGHFEFQSSVNRTQATTDDAISITMMITGDGDIKRVQPPPLLLSDSFEIYPPKIIEENITENQEGVIGRKIIEYLVLPKLPGNYILKPSINYFNTETTTYERLMAGPYLLQIKQGSDKHISQMKPEDQEVASNDIRIIKKETKLEKKRRYFMGSSAFIIAACLPLLTFVGLVFIKRSKKISAPLNGAMQHNKSANKVALDRLATAHVFLQSGSSRLFYDEISKASLGYVCDKMGIPLSELSKDNVRERLLSINVPLPLVEGFMQIVKTCEMAIFAGMDNSPEMKGIYDKTVNLISSMEKEIENN